MIIQRLALKNVKSYREGVIDFAPGVNLICGENGAGKSTIIEAIGFALFGVQPPMKKEEFIHSGQKSCLVQVWFSAGGREYRVDRSMRASGGGERWEVYFGEEQMDLHNRADVLPFLREAMGIAPSIDLDELFSQMIAIGQNEFLTPFLMTPARRIAEFNGILGVESYRRASDALLPAERQIEERVRDLRMAMESLRESQERLLEYEQGLAAARETLTAAQAQGERAAQRASIAGELETLTERIQNLEESRKSLQERVERAEDAGIRTGALETEYREYRTLEEELARLLEESRILTIQWKEQQELARRHGEATARAGERRSRGKWLLEEAGKERKRLEEEKEVCSCSIEEVALEVSTARDIAEKEAEAHRRAEDAAAGGSAIRYAGRRGAELLEERSRARALAGKRTELLTRREALRSEQSRMERLAQRERILGETSVQLQERIAYMKQGAAQMASGTCPVAGVPCPLGEGMDPSFLEARTAELTEELAALQEERMDVSQALAASNLTEAFLALERELTQCAQGEAQAMELTEAMEELMLGLRESLAPEEQVALERFLDVLPEEGLPEFEGWAQEIAQEREKEERRLREELDGARQILRDAETRHERLKEELSALDSRLADCLKKQEEGERLLEEAGALELELQTEGYREEALKLAEEAYAQVIAKQNACAQRMQTLRPAYEEYRIQQSLAQTADSLKRERKAADEELAALEERRGRLVHALEELGSLGESAQKLRQMAQEAALAVGQAQEAVNGAQARYQEAEERAGRYRMLQTQAQEKERALSWMGDLRDVLKRAGGPMARAIRERVSARAGELYRSISGESGQLRWEESFDILIGDTLGGMYRQRRFGQLSGGEKMTAALAVRLALIQTFSSLSLAFFDEPTSNLDAQRRGRLGEMLPRAVEGFDQLFLISHDDAFYSITENVVYLEKTSGGTIVRE